MKAALCLIVALGYLAYTAYAMPTTNSLKEDEDGISLDIDPNLFITFLEATDPNMALKILTKILGVSNIQNIQKQVQGFSEGSKHSQKLIKDLDPISIKVDRNLFLSFLEATDPQLALKALPKILGKSNIHLMRRHIFNEHEMFNTHHNEHPKEKIFRLYWMVY